MVAIPGDPGREAELRALVPRARKPPHKLVAFLLMVLPIPLVGHVITLAEIMLWQCIVILWHTARVQEYKIALLESCAASTARILTGETDARDSDGKPPPQAKHSGYEWG